ncbi:MAG: thiamine diphosphokinase [Clostridia bacterium]|nr:thiamine diphosphokinase [Clostridia bacterium]
MRAFIYTGGKIYPENITEHPKADDVTIAADAGYKNALLLGDTAQILVGDFDSLDDDGISENVKKIQVPAQKDFSDTQLAVDTALKMGINDIVIIGGLSGRLDHTLANLSIIKELTLQNVFAIITDGKNRVRYVRSTSTLIPRSGYRYLSLIADGEKIKGVDIEGCKYPLKNATITEHDQSLTISNEIVGNCALISVKRGGVYVIESAD